jgi:D-methionine transport system substrate-binding protein
MRQTQQSLFGRKTKLSLAVASALVLALVVAQPARAAAPLTIGVTPGPNEQILDHAAGLAAAQGLDVKIVVFNDWNTPNTAVADGDVDANVYQHKPFLAVVNQTKHLGLVAVAPAYIFPVGLFSHKVKSLADVPDGAHVAVANDPVNRGRGLELFQKAGLITLKPGVGDLATVADITANPKHLRFVELEAPQLVRALDDVSVAQVSFTFLLASGGDPTGALITDGANNQHYAIQIVTRPDEVNDPRLQKFITIFHSADEKAFIETKYKGFFAPAW